VLSVLFCHWWRIDLLCVRRLLFAPDVAEAKERRFDAR